MSRYLNGPGNPIGWCDYTWNPVTGCRRDCVFGPNHTPCYARTISERFGGRFEPTFHPERLGAPGKLVEGVQRPWRIFVCSMGDLFGPWVPDEWIGQVVDVARACHEHTFQFLTKYPVRLAVDWPSNCWVGTTIYRQAEFHSSLTALCIANAPVRFISFEPLSEHIDTVSMGENLLTENIDWAIIGGCTGSGARQPELPWVEGIERSGVPVFHKANLACRHGALRRTEFPKAMEG